MRPLEAPNRAIEWMARALLGGSVKEPTDVQPDSRPDRLQQSL
jgi:hypothetical protein